MSEPLRQILEELSIEKLEDLIQDSIGVDNPKFDSDTVLVMMGVLRDKKRRINEEETYGVKEMWDRFCEKYLPDAENNGSTKGAERALVEEIRGELSDGSSPSVSVEMPKRRRSNFGVTFRAASIALVAGILLMSIISTTAYARGFDLWGIVARWTAEQFNFVRADNNDIPRTADYVGRYKTLEEALASNGIDEPLAPTWLPEGYALSRLEIDDNSAQISFSAEYVSSEMLIIGVTIVQYNEDTDFAIREKDENDVQVYVVDDVTHYIMSNLERTIITWIYNNCICTIRGEFSEEIGQQIVNSIYER